MANLGSIAMAAGKAATLDMRGDGLIEFVVTDAVSGVVSGPNGESLASYVSNTGTLQADGGMVTMSAQAVTDVIKSVVNQEGVIRAQSMEERNGVVVLSGGSEGIVSVAGTIDASGAGAGQTGGTVHVLGEKVGLFDNANINVSGDVGGGTALIGGDFQGKNPAIQNAFRTYVGSDATINADAITSGNGGKVIVWADDTTRFYGTLTARGGAQSGDGGFAEVSGKESLSFDGSVDLRAPKGAAGTILLDPKDIFVQTTDTDNGATAQTTAAALDQFSDNPTQISGISVTNFQTLLDAAHVTLQANNDIVFVNAVTATATNFTLTLNAGRTIDIRDNISVGGAFTAIANIADVAVVQANRTTASVGEFKMTVPATLRFESRPATQTSPSQQTRHREISR